MIMRWGIEFRFLKALMSAFRYISSNMTSLLHHIKISYEMSYKGPNLTCNILTLYKRYYLYNHLTRAICTSKYDDANLSNIWYSSIKG